MSLINLIPGQRPNPTGMTPQEQVQTVAGSRMMPAPITRGTPSFIASRDAVPPQMAPPTANAGPSFGQKISNFFSDEDKVAKLILALEPLRGPGGQGGTAARWAQSHLQTSRETNLLNRQGNRTAEALRAAARNESNQSRKMQLNNAADLVENNPSMAKEAASLLFDKTSTTTDAFRTKHQSAIAAGLEPGTKEYQRFMGAESDYGGIGDEALSGISGIRKEFMGIPEVKAFQGQANSFGRIKASAEDPDAAGDLALIFNYMKLLDPGSVVREGEFATAQNAAGVPDRITNLYNNVLEGTRLGEDQRKEFLDRAEKIYNDAERQYESFEKQYKKFMTPFVPENKTVDDFFPSFRYTPKESTSNVPPGVNPEIWKNMTQQERSDWESSSNG